MIKVFLVLKIRTRICYPLESYLGLCDTLWTGEKVSDVLKRYNIHLSNPSLDEFTYSAIPFIMLNNVNYLESYVSASDTVSSFSINSNSGSGGFGGGGFSGGGGGGGGGAF